MTLGGTLSEKLRNATTQWRPSVCKVAGLGVTFVFSVSFAGCKLIGVCSPLKCDFSEFACLQTLVNSRVVTTRFVVIKTAPLLVKS
jgi:hypothetical protein